MRTATEKRDAPGVARGSRKTSRATRRAADALLREHPDAVIFAQSAEGHIVPVPDSLNFDGYEVLAEEGRTGVDLCVSEDRMAVVNAWIELKRNGVAEVRARLRSEPQTWRTVRMLDLRSMHGVVLTIGWVSDEQQAGSPARTDAAAVSTAPRFCTRRQDSEGNVTECDEAYLQMFGFGNATEVVGQPTFERVHPDDQARLIESWIAMVATARPQMTRVRMRCENEGWLWVDTTYHNYLGETNDGYVLAECIDVSAEMAAQEALQDREELLRRLLEEMPDGLLQIDGQGSVVYHNARLLEILAAPPLPAEGEGAAAAPSIESLLAALPADATDAFKATIGTALSDGLRADLELETAGETERRYILFKVRPLLRESALVTGVIVSVQDVTDVARARRELEKQASTDPLTGAHNRSAIIAALGAEIHESEAAGVIYVDLDRFKRVNDTLGHAAGDELLVQVTDRLRRAMRANDFLGRLGGDEFLVVLHRVAGLEAAMGAGERISEALRGSYQLSGAAVELSASIGVAFVDEERLSAEDLIERADDAMYRSKRRRQGVPVLARC